MSGSKVSNLPGARINPGASNLDDLPVNKSDDFIGEFECMNLDELRDKRFLIAISTGKREQGRFISQTIRGPYDYWEMLEEVGYMFQEEQHHAKVIITNKERDKPNKFLDENTTDYIEANWVSLSAEVLLEDEDKEYTCRAGINTTDPNDDPRTAGDEEE